MISRDTLNCFDGDDRAVSPVVGVALLIAITVILAAVIGFVVLNANTESTSAKNARLDFAGTADTTVTHNGGDSFAAKNVVVKVNGVNQGTLASSNFTIDGSTFNTGDSFTVTTASGETVAVIWQDPESDRETQLGEYVAE